METPTTKIAERPKIAVIGSNTLALIGMRQLLQSVMPMVEVDTLGSFTELTANHPDEYFHYFVTMEIVLSERAFFFDRRRKTIVLTTAQKETVQLSDFHCLYINQPEQQLLHALLQLEQSAHRGGRNLPATATEPQQRQVLTRREVEVMSLIVQGYINKEVAERLHIGLSTVITHRKNIMEKLGMKSVSALTIYAVTHGYVDVDKVKG
jgi:DNA-binding CsgD family transcriptional regulator